MQISWQRDESPYAVSGIDGIRVRIGAEWREHSLYVHPRNISPWRPQLPAEITREDLDVLLAESPDVILIGTGAQVCLLPPALQVHVLRRGIGVECMSNAAAARTYNVLLGEGRAVLAAFLITPAQ
ncbi:MAG: Mth938-like domain-containing protein [Lysobacterales bacterium]